MSTIDHKAEAVELIGKAGYMPADDPANAAQAHAILALVEQQRIANLIAYVALLESQFREAVSHPQEFHAPTKAAALDRHKVAQRLIRVGLGL